MGGITWERRPIDPIPGPRRLDELIGAERLNDVVALAGPDTTGPGGFRFAESRMSGVLGERTVLVDPTSGPRAIAAGLAGAAAHLGWDLVVFVDVGGDVLAHGDEPGLASPLCDAMLLAAATWLAPQTPAIAAVFGAGCDGELTPAEVLDRIAEVTAAGGLLGAWGLEPPVLERLEAAAAAVPTEASAQALRCARGETGVAAIRGGARPVQRTPAGALTFYLDPHATLASAARLAAAVRDASDLEDAQARLDRIGVVTELAREQAAAGS